MMWSYQGQPFSENLIEKNIGFVYIITNTVSGKKYIGKKLFKHRRNKKQVESDWRKYYGSNEVLLEDVKALRRECIYQGDTQTL